MSYTTNRQYRLARSPDHFSDWYIQLKVTSSHIGRTSSQGLGTGNIPIIHYFALLINGIMYATTRVEDLRNNCTSNSTLGSNIHCSRDLL